MKRPPTRDEIEAEYRRMAEAAATVKTEDGRTLPHVVKPLEPPLSFYRVWF